MEGPDHPTDWTIVEDSTSELPQEGEELDNTLVAEQPPSPSPSQFVTQGQNCSSPPTSVADGSNPSFSLLQGQGGKGRLSPEKFTLQVKLINEN